MQLWRNEVGRMRCRQAVRGFVVMIGLGGLATACVAPIPESTSAAQALGSGSDEPPDPPPVCEDRPRCTLDFEGGSLSLQIQLHCSKTYRYWSGGNGGFLGGIGSYCPDNLATRTALRNHHIRGYASDYCDDCLSIPAGNLFAFWNEFSGPSCPSSCVDPPSDF
jgi:hypothetical protein